MFSRHTDEADESDKRAGWAGMVATQLVGIARVWYTIFGLVFLVMLENAWRYGEFGKLFHMFAGMRPVGWVVIAALLAPGPLAHWLAVRLRS